MEATKVKVRERGTLSSSHMTSNPLSASLPPSSPPLSPPLASSPVLAHVSAYRFLGPPRKRHHLTGRSNSDGENRVLRGTGLRYVTRVTLSVSTFHRALRSRFREGSRLKRCAAVEKARIAFFPAPLLDQRADSRYLRIGDGGATVTHRPAVTQRNA